MKGIFPLVATFLTLTTTTTWAANTEPLSFCEKYALEASTQVDTNKSASCGLSGALWNKGYLDQVSWCKTVKPAEADKANAQRSDQIVQCLAKQVMTGKALKGDKQDNSMLVSFMVGRYLKPATEWYMGMEQVLLPQGRPLTAAEKNLAAKVGVKNAYKVRVVVTDNMPVPNDLLGSMAVLFKSNTARETGRAMGYALLMRPQYANNQQLLAHLLGYVAKIEQVGHRAFLEQYATEMLIDGYNQSKLVKEAAHAAK
ncbi:MAG: hypothetical protein WAQ53_12230 [Thiofilum sp.]|uniref:hypothetical protein n=1 Tax=Thiofilum sp. TaxID=2212733 RepID=UPI0025F17123|nr:hypothetical protein [Thiofilum sp.]MBK8454286.1 hypothetical protein [Thiofilum sp.]